MISLAFKKAQANFFDSPKVLKALDRATRKALSKFGAFVRRRAQTSIRKRKKVSDPGQPPSGHTGFLRRSILFSYDAARKSVVIGPTGGGPSPAAPRLLEHGGTGDVKTKKGTARGTYRARPFMGPALQAELPGLAGMWKDSVKT
jgi:hypothetical protein